MIGSKIKTASYGAFPVTGCLGKNGYNLLFLKSLSSIERFHQVIQHGSQKSVFPKQSAVAPKILSYLLLFLYTNSQAERLRVVEFQMMPFLHLFPIGK